MKPGQIMQLGDHRLACGDARDHDLVKRLVGKDQIKLIASDVPYGVSYTESKAGFKQKLGSTGEIANDHYQSDAEYRRFTKEWLEAAKPYLAPKNAVYIFNSDKMLFALRDGMQDAGCRFCQLLIWVKTHSVVGRLDYLPQHELIAYGWFGTHEFVKAKDKSVLVYPKPNRSKFHPTMKPVGLMRNLILNSSRVEDVVYDPFLGAGTTLLACEQTKRRCLAIELDAQYCQTTIDRWCQLTGKEVRYVED